MRDVLTALLLLDVKGLEDRIKRYRYSLALHHHPGRGKVTLMLHTFIGEDLELVRETVKGPFLSYLRSHVELLGPMAASQDVQLGPDRMSPDDREALLSFTFDRYFNTSSLCGAASTCRRMVAQFEAIGVDEIACLIDFGIDLESTMASRGCWIS